MRWRKRLRVIIAAVFQQWHEKQCGECGTTWMALGRLRPDLIDICDGCEQEAINRLEAHTEREYQRLMKGVV